MKILLPILMVGVLAIVVILGFVITGSFNQQVQIPQSVPNVGETPGGEQTGIPSGTSCSEIGLDTGNVSSIDVSYNMVGEEETVHIRARNLQTDNADFRMDITGTEKGEVTYIYNSEESVAYVYEADSDIWREIPEGIASRTMCSTQGSLIRSAQNWAEGYGTGTHTVTKEGKTVEVDITVDPQLPDSLFEPPAGATVEKAS